MQTYTDKHNTHTHCPLLRREHLPIFDMGAASLQHFTQPLDQPVP